MLRQLKYCKYLFIVFIFFLINSCINPNELDLEETENVDVGVEFNEVKAETPGTISQTDTPTKTVIPTMQTIGLQYREFTNGYTGFCIPDDRFFTFNLEDGFIDELDRHYMMNYLYQDKLYEPWQQIKSNGVSINPSTLLVREIEGLGFEIWVKDYSRNTNEGESFFYIYQEWRNEWISIRNPDVSIYVGFDNNIWAIQKPNWFDEEPDYLKLMKLNEETYSFESVDFTGIGEIQIHEETTHWVFSVSNNSVYLFDFGEYLYSINLDNYSVEKTLRLSEYSGVITNDSLIYPLKNGDVFIRNMQYLDPEIYPGTHSNSWLIYDSVYNEFRNIKQPDGFFPEFFSVAIDSTGRIWADDYGWISPEGEFITIYSEKLTIPSYEQYHAQGFRYRDTKIDAISSNDILWFSSSNYRSTPGLAWYDPNTEEECWFAYDYKDFPSVVVTSDGIVMWVVYNNELYRYKKP